MMGERVSQVPEYTPAIEVEFESDFNFEDSYSGQTGRELKYPVQYLVRQA